MTDLTDEQIAADIRADVAALHASLCRAEEAGINVRIEAFHGVWIDTTLIGDRLREFTPPSVAICKKL